MPRDTIVARFRELKVSLGRSPKQQELVDNVEGLESIRTLQDHLTDYGLPWPIE